jgi:hypothetical protein
MLVKEELLMQWTNTLEGDENVLIRKCDLTPIADDTAKIEKVLHSVISFLVQAGLDSQELMGMLDIQLLKAKTHPDNDDFYLESKVEEHMSNKKDSQEFYEQLESSLHTYTENDEVDDFLKEVYRHWLIVNYLKLQGKEE